MLERFLDKTSFSSQEDFMKNFKVKVPDCFNFGYDVVDEWARIAPEKKSSALDQRSRKKNRFYICRY